MLIHSKDHEDVQARVAAVRGVDVLLRFSVWQHSLDKGVKSPPGPRRAKTALHPHYFSSFGSNSSREIAELVVPHMPSWVLPLQCICS